MVCMSLCVFVCVDSVHLGTSRDSLVHCNWAVRVKMFFSNLSVNAIVSIKFDVALCALTLVKQ